MKKMRWIGLFVVGVLALIGGLVSPMTAGQAQANVEKARVVVSVWPKYAWLFSDAV